MGNQAFFGGKIEVTAEAAEMLAKSPQMLKIKPFGNGCVIKPAKAPNLLPDDVSFRIGESLIFISKQDTRSLDPKSPVEISLKNGALSAGKRD